MQTIFPEIRKNFGFGCMRFPMADGQVDIPAVTRMVDTFLDAGFNYFDTARPYHSGNSEKVLKTCLTSRYPRDRYLLTNKLSPSFFKCEAGIRPLFEDQLKTCGVDYFDFYLLHANSAQRHQYYTETRAYEIVQELKAEGKIRHVGMSFHDTAEVLDQILTEHPELEVVQIQFNYADYEDPIVQSKACYEVCRKHGKPVLVMEPVKGGSLAQVSPKAQAMLETGSAASYAIRFAAGFEGIVMVLSGMSNQEQLEDNLAFMTDFHPLSQQEQETVSRLRTQFQAEHRIPCTACRYCTDGCPAGIDIPKLFAAINQKHLDNPEADAQYREAGGNADACVECGQCEAACPQHLHIRELLKQVAAEF